MLLEKCIAMDGFRPEVYAFAKDLKNRYRMAMITNQLQDWFEIAAKDHAIRELFELIVTSYESGLAKPDLEIYNFTLEKLGVPAAECVFIDDMEKNVRAAEAVGMHGIVFQNFEQLKADLQKLDVE
jgi:putative hydrolase of the HAD superfamily